MIIKGVPPRRIDESNYDRQMRKEYLRPYLSALAEELKEAGNSTTAWIAAITAFNARWGRLMDYNFPEAVIRRWMERVSDAHARSFIRQFARAKVDVRQVIAQENIYSKLRKYILENKNLISTIPDRMKDGVLEKMLQAEREAPLDMLKRERIFRQEAKLSGYNLRRITRDQTNKLSGKLSEIRQTNAGIDQYRWDTSEDDRVRPTHAANHTLVFSWAKPPDITGHPGHDIQCRCVALPEISLADIKQRFG